MYSQRFSRVTIRGLGFSWVATHLREQTYYLEKFSIASAIRTSHIRHLYHQNYILVSFIYLAAGVEYMEAFTFLGIDFAEYETRIQI